MDFKTIKERYENVPTFNPYGNNEMVAVLKDDLDWFMEQAENLEKIRNAFYDKDTDVIECYRKQIEVFEGKETPIRKKRR
jgi:hypothetical protein